MDELLLISGNDIPFPRAELTIHQPTVEEIAFIGEQTFFTGVNYLNFRKSHLMLEEQEQLEGLEDFQVLMFLLGQTRDLAALTNSASVEMVLTLMFPGYRVIFAPTGINLLDEETNNIHTIGEEEFSDFRTIVYKMFALDMAQGGQQREYDPKDALAKKIVDKIKKGREKLNQLKKGQDGQMSSILSRYISILAVGEQKDINILKKYTVYQLFDEFHRFSLKQSFDLNIKARLAGATDIEDAEDWMGDIHSKSDDDNL